jgi:hypothetical protein
VTTALRVASADWCDLRVLLGRHGRVVAECGHANGAFGLVRGASAGERGRDSRAMHHGRARPAAAAAAAAALPDHAIPATPQDLAATFFAFLGPMSRSLSRMYRPTMDERLIKAVMREGESVKIVDFISCS